MGLRVKGVLPLLRPSVGDKFSPVAGHKMLYGTLAPRVEQLRNKVSHQR